MPSQPSFESLAFIFAKLRWLCQYCQFMFLDDTLKPHRWENTFLETADSQTPPARSYPYFIVQSRQNLYHMRLNKLWTSSSLHSSQLGLEGQKISISDSCMQKGILRLKWSKWNRTNRRTSSLVGIPCLHRCRGMGLQSGRTPGLGAYGHTHRRIRRFCTVKSGDQ